MGWYEAAGSSGHSRTRYTHMKRIINATKRWAAFRSSGSQSGARIGIAWFLARGVIRIYRRIVIDAGAGE